MTSLLPECDIQPRSAVISRRPGEGEAVEKFDQHAHEHTQVHMGLHAQTTAETKMTHALNKATLPVMWERLSQNAFSESHCR